MLPFAQLLLTEAPTIISFFRGLHSTADPNAPVLTSEEVIAGLEAVFSNSIARDEFLKAALKAEISGQK